MLSSVYHTGPVTALTFNGSCIFAGIGSHLQIYRAESTEPVQCLEVLPARVIHGVQPDKGNGDVTTMCIYGQKCLQLIQFDSDAMTAKPVGNMTEFADWIWNVSWMKVDDSEKSVCLALGHNVIVVYNVGTESITRTVDCEEKCILYCAKFVSCTEKCIVLASGTVFNQVVLWSLQSTPNKSGRVEPFHRLTGHQGVIFSLDINLPLKLVCSVSDDRSIRLYQVTFQLSGDLGSSHDVDDLDLQAWESMESTLLHVLYGHSARVWDVKLLSFCLVSVGEDSTCCVWTYDGQVIQKFKGHKGKSIWSVTVDKGENYIATGGGDNSIRLWKLKNQEGDNCAVQPSAQVVDLQLETADFPRNTALLDTATVITITNSGNLVVFSRSSGQCHCVMSDPAFASYTLMVVLKERRYVALASIHGTLRILEITGDERMEMICDTKVCEGKIFSLLWIQEDFLLTTGPDGVVNVWRLWNRSLTMIYRLELPVSKHRWVASATFALDSSRLLCGDRCGSLFLYELDYQNQSGSLLQSFTKMHGKAGVTYTGCHGDQVYTAGRDGMYRTFVWSNGQLTLLHVNRVCKGYEWVERLVFTQDDDVHIYGFLSNYFVVWSVQQNQKLLQIDCGGGHRSWDYSCHGNKATFVCVKARAVKVTDAEMRSNQVIVKQCLHGRELCDAKFVAIGTDGKGNTIYAVVTCSEDTNICLNFLHDCRGLSTLDVCQTLSGHISTVRCLYVCAAIQETVEERENPSSSLKENVAFSCRKLIFSAGGRAQLKVWRVTVNFAGQNSDGESKLTSSEYPEKTLDKKEGKSASRIDTECDAASVTTDKNKSVQHAGTRHRCAFSYKSLAGLQLSHINRKVKKPWRQQADNSDPETRILDLSVVASVDIGQLRSRSLYFIAAACSDGFLRLLSFDEVSTEIALLASSPYHDHCLLKITHVILHNTHVTRSCDPARSHDSESWPVRVVVLSAATDGKVAFWDITDICRQCTDVADLVEENKKVHKQTSEFSLEPFFCLSLHQSGINSLFIGEYAAGDTYILITGGDDNALKVNIVSMVTSEVKVTASVLARGCNLQAHATQITGTWYISPDQVLTASIDQRISLWKIYKEGSQIQIQLLNSLFTSVSDVSNIDVYKHGSAGEEHMILVSGNGLEAVRLNSGKEKPPEQ